MAGSVSIIDYGMGNLHSVVKQFRACGAVAEIVSTPEEVLSAEKIVLPGVGHLGKAMANLKELDLIEALHTAVLEQKTPILGICLGMQLMCSHSEEGNSEGLGWFDATVHKFHFEDTLNYKVPHIGWNSITMEKESPLMRGIDNGALMYFVHSFYAKSNGSDRLNTTTYKETFVSALSRDNIFGVQYHPEKSHDVGKRLIQNFIDL